MTDLEFMETIVELVGKRFHDNKFSFVIIGLHARDDETKPFDPPIMMTDLPLQFAQDVMRFCSDETSLNQDKPRKSFEVN